MNYPLEPGDMIYLTFNTDHKVEGKLQRGWIEKRSTSKSTSTTRSKFMAGNRNVSITENPDLDVDEPFITETDFQGMPQICCPI